MIKYYSSPTPGIFWRVDEDETVTVITNSRRPRPDASFVDASWLAQNRTEVQREDVPEELRAPLPAPEHQITYRGYEVPAGYLTPTMFGGVNLDAWKAGIDTVLDSKRAFGAYDLVVDAPAFRTLSFSNVVESDPLVPYADWEKALLDPSIEDDEDESYTYFGYFTPDALDHGAVWRYRHNEAEYSTGDAARRDGVWTQSYTDLEAMRKAVDSSKGGDYRYLELTEEQIKDETNATEYDYQDNDRTGDYGMYLVLDARPGQVYYRSYGMHVRPANLIKNLDELATRGLIKQGRTRVTRATLS